MTSGELECYHSYRSVVSPSSFPPFSTNTHTQTRLSLLSPHPSNISHKPSAPQSSSSLQVRWPLQWQGTKINLSVKGERECMRAPAWWRLLYWVFEDHISHLPPYWTPLFSLLLFPTLSTHPSSPSPSLLHSVFANFSTVFAYGIVFYFDFEHVHHLISWVLMYSALLSERHNLVWSSVMVDVFPFV